MDVQHQYVVQSDDGHRIVFVCPVEGCGRRVVFERGARRYVVIDVGDFFARHSGTVGPLSISLSL